MARKKEKLALRQLQHDPVPSHVEIPLLPGIFGHCFLLSEWVPWLILHRRAPAAPDFAGFEKSLIFWLIPKSASKAGQRERKQAGLKSVCKITPGLSASTSPGLKVDSKQSKLILFT